MKRGLTALIAASALGGCGGDRLDDCRVVAHPNVTTMLRARFTSEAPGTSYVEYGPDESLGASTPITATSGTEHEHLILGLGPLDDVYWRAVVVTDDGRELTCEGMTPTGNVPASLPDVESEIHDEAAMSPEDWIYGGILGHNHGAFVINRATGKWAWYHESTDDAQAVDIQPAAAGEGFVVSRQAVLTHDRNGSLAGLTWDGEVAWVEEASSIHHFFGQKPDGTVAYVLATIRTGIHPITGQKVDIVGDDLVERRPDGTTRVVFSTWDRMDVEWNEGWAREFYNDAYDWTHANNVFYDEARDAYLVSFANLNAVYEIDANTGDILRTFGGEDGYPRADGQEAFLEPHAAHWTEDGTLLLAAEHPGGIGGVEYVVDDATGTLEEVWSFTHEGDLASVALSAVRRLDNGNRLMVFGLEGHAMELGPDDEVVWELSTKLGAYFGRVTAMYATQPTPTAR